MSSPGCTSGKLFIDKGARSQSFDVDQRGIEHWRVIDSSANAGPFEPDAINGISMGLTSCAAGKDRRTQSAAMNSSIKAAVAAGLSTIAMWPDCGISAVSAPDMHAVAALAANR